MDQGTVPTAVADPEVTVDIHNLHPFPLTLYFLHLQSDFSCSGLLAP